LILVVLLVFVWRKYGRGFFSSGEISSNVEMMKKYDENDLYRRQEAMLAARMRMQEAQDRMSAQHLELEKQKEEEKRRKKLEDYQNFIDGKGYHNKQHFEETSPNITKKPKTAKKPPLRQDDYNPLMGNSGNTGYRPSRRGCGPSGGG